MVKKCEMLDTSHLQWLPSWLHTRRCRTTNLFSNLGKWLIHQEDVVIFQVLSAGGADGRIVKRSSISVGDKLHPVSVEIFQSDQSRKTGIFPSHQALHATSYCCYCSALKQCRKYWHSKNQWTRNCVLTALRRSGPKRTNLTLTFTSGSQEVTMPAMFSAPNSPARVWTSSTGWK